MGVDAAVNPATNASISTQADIRGCRRAGAISIASMLQYRR
jgi:hypothetical protein